ncbi:MAG: hypothetical protein KDJ31_16650 [Candidatus Competibacteraceae bacterium]|nr:hypothetical protein [Candidatus Competibacteraceae bacterium]MCB1821455.1 hypothetical protein [Candidatus Competibacteraceae bacterium]
MRHSTAASESYPEKWGIRFHHVTEIHMGSPYPVGQIRWSGAWTPDLPTTDWQDLQV